MADMTLWTKDDKIIVDENGKLIICDRCPCEGPSLSSSSSSSSYSSYSSSSEDLCAKYRGTSINYRVLYINNYADGSCDIGGELESGSANFESCSVSTGTGNITVNYSAVVDGHTYHLYVTYSSGGAITGGSFGDDGWICPVLTADEDFCGYREVCIIE